MPSLQRFRSRPYGSVPKTGKLRQDVTPVWGSPFSNEETSGAGWVRGVENCDDSITISGPYEDHDFNLYRRSMQTGGISGSYDEITISGSHYHWTFDGWMPDSRLGNTAELASITFPEVNTAYWQTKALANINPSVPTVDLLNFAFELREFPRMLRDLGRVLQGQVRPSDVPGGYLAYEFGWKPLINDVTALMFLQRDIQNRLQTLKQANGSTGVSRTLSSTTSPVGGPSLHNLRQTFSDGRKLVVALTATMSRRVWYTGSLEIPEPEKEGLERLLRSNSLSSKAFLLGLNSLSASTIWNSIPWSWLVDYFINVGDFLEAGRGSIPFKLKGVNLMVHDLYEETTEVVQNDYGLSYTPHKGVVERKRRYVIGLASPQIRFTPGLSQGQQGILTALATASALRGARS